MCYVESWSEYFFKIKNVKNTVPQTYVISGDLNGEVRVEKIIKRKSDKLYVKRFYYATIAD